jgi:hypothetical protein
VIYHADLIGAFYVEFTEHGTGICPREAQGLALYVYSVFILLFNSNFIMTQYVFSVTTIFLTVFGNGITYGFGSEDFK